MATTEAVQIKEAVQSLIEGLVIPWPDEGPGSSYRAATHTGGMPRRGMWHTSRADQDDGRYRPYYESIHDLTRQRAISRGLFEYSPVVKAISQALKVYTMGGDWTYEVAPKGDQAPPELIEACQKIVDSNLEFNDFLCTMQREIHDKSREDGEAPIAVYPSSAGLVRMEVLNADNIDEPANPQALDQWLGLDDGLADKSVSSWTFGVHTVFDPVLGRINHGKPQGYHVVFDDHGSEWDYMPRNPRRDMDGGKFLHLIKRNVPQKAKRGVTDYYTAIVDVERDDKLNENLSVNAAVNAAIAWIEEQPEGTPKGDVAANVLDSLDQFSRGLRNLRTGETPKNFQPGTVAHVAAGKKYHQGPMGQLKSEIFISVGQALKRRMGAIWLMPEYMISGDASNANFASTLVSSHPFVKAREDDQCFYCKEFEKLFLKALKVAHDHGAFDKWVTSWPILNSLIEVKVTPTSPATQDRAQLVQELSTLFHDKIITGQTYATRAGFDPDDAEERPPEPQQFGLPGNDQGQAGTNGNTPSTVGSPSGNVARRVNSSLQNQARMQAGAVQEHRPGGHDHDQSSHGRRGGDGSDIEPDDEIPAHSIVELNKVQDQAKFDSIRKSLESDGWQGRPVLVMESAHGHEALTGSHRILAARDIDPDFEVPAVVISFDMLDLEADGVPLHEELSTGVVRDEDRAEILSRFARSHSELRNAADLMQVEVEVSDSVTLTEDRLREAYLETAIQNAKTPEEALDWIRKGRELWEHTPGGHEHDQQRHGNRGGGSGGSEGTGKKSGGRERLSTLAKESTSTLSEESRQVADQAFDEVMGAIPEGAFEGAQEVTSFEVFENTEDVTSKLDEGVQDRLKGRGMQAAGFWDRSTGQLVVDGLSGGKEEYAQVLAHEVAHVIDGGRSSKSGWVSVWEEEIGFIDNPVSEYAEVSEREGFAEFARFAWTDPANAKHFAPQSWNFFVQEGLVKDFDDPVDAAIERAKARAAAGVTLPTRPSVSSGSPPPSLSLPKNVTKRRRGGVGSSRGGETSAANLIPIFTAAVVTGTYVIDAVKRSEEEEERRRRERREGRDIEEHLPGEHDQKKHGRRGGGGSLSQKAEKAKARAAEIRLEINQMSQDVLQFREKGRKLQNEKMEALDAVSAARTESDKAKAREKLFEVSERIDEHNKQIPEQDRKFAELDALERRATLEAQAYGWADRNPSEFGERFVSDDGNFALHESFREAAPGADIDPFGRVAANKGERGALKNQINRQVAEDLAGNIDAEKIHKADAEIQRATEISMAAGLGGLNDTITPISYAGAMDIAAQRADGKGGDLFEVNESAEGVSQRLLDSWAASSTDGNHVSAAMQIAVADKFGDDPSQIAALDSSAAVAGRVLYERNQEVFDQWVDGTYRRTQEQLQASGVSEVVLFRGMTATRDQLPESFFRDLVRFDPETRDTVAQASRISQNPISSWAMAPSVASSFADKNTSSREEYSLSTAAVIPRERIFATAATGPGCLTESEVLVVGADTIEGRTFATNDSSRIPVSLPDWLEVLGDD